MFVFMSRQQNVGQNYKTDTRNISFENVAKCKYLEKNLQILQSKIRKKVKTQILIAHMKKLQQITFGKLLLQFGSKFLSLVLMFKCINSYTQEPLILPVVLCGCKTWSLT